MAQDVDKILEELRNRKNAAAKPAAKPAEVKPAEKEAVKETVKETVTAEKTARAPISAGGMNALSHFMNDDSAEIPAQTEAVAQAEETAEDTEEIIKETAAAVSEIKGKKSDDYIDDKFRDFFTQQVIVTKTPEETRNVEIKKHNKRGIFRRKYITDSLSLNVDKEEAENSAKSAHLSSTGEIKTAAADNVARIMDKKSSAKQPEKAAEKPAVKTPEKTETKPAAQTAKPETKPDSSKAVRKTLDADALVAEILAQKNPQKADETAPAKTETAPEKAETKPAAPQKDNSIVSRIYNSVTVSDETGYMPPVDETETAENTQAETDEKSVYETAAEAITHSGEIKTSAAETDTDSAEAETEENIGYKATGEFLSQTESDGENIIDELFDFRKTLSRRVIIGAAVGFVLMIYNLMGTGGWGLPGIISPAENPVVYYIIAAVIYAVCFAAFIPTIISGLKADKNSPRADTFVSLSAILSLAQLLCGILFAENGSVEDMTIFGAYTAFALCFNAMGKIISTDTIIKNMKLADVPDGINAGYIIKDADAVRELSRTLDEKVPYVLVSRKTGAISDFIESGFSVHACEYRRRKVALISYGVTALCFVLGIIRTGGGITGRITGGVICAAGAAAIQIPLSHTLVSSVPRALMQKSLEKVGALINGWRGIDRLSKTSHVSFDAKYLFPRGTVVLDGIKAFEKDRIDIAILYAAAVLTDKCEVLRPVFSEIIGGRLNILPEVDSCEYIERQGYVAWVKNSRVILGNRTLMNEYDIAIPENFDETAYTKNGRKIIYLSVAGKLFGMFVLSYYPDKIVKENIDKLAQKGVSLILTSDDFNIDSQLIRQVYGINSENVNVLNQKDTRILREFTDYAPESEARLAHLDSLPSLVAGFYRAESTKNSEDTCSIIQAVTVFICALLAILFTFNATLPGLSLLSVALIGFAFMGITMLFAFIKRYQ